MSNTDSFIDEVSEEVRREQLWRLVRRWGWLPILLVVLLVGGATYNEIRKSNERAAAEALGDGITAALEGDIADRAQALDALAADGAGAAIVGFLTSAGEIDGDDPDAGVARLTAIEADMNLPEHYRHLATLKRIMATADTRAPDERIAALGPLTVVGAPYRLLALEQTAIAQVEAGDAESAISGLRGILVDSEATEGLRRRATQLIVALGADPSEAAATE
ncbi:MAG: hypothetical protein GKR99_06390 [Rhodobacteraceae bacterium]|nr:hypothetical protein [Paracoccaceae bacterium]